MKDTFNICMVTTFHPPFDNRIFYKEAKSLTKYYNVTVVAPSSEIQNGIYDGVKVVTVPSPTAKIFYPITLWRTFLQALRQDADIYHCHEMESLIIGIIIKILKKKRVIFDVHEHWPSMWTLMVGNLLRMNIFKYPSTSAFFQRVIGRFELFLAHFSDELIVVSDSVGELFQKQNVPFTVIMNVPRADITASETILKKPHMLIYMGGNLGFSKGTEIAAGIISSLKKEYPDISLKIIGRTDRKFFEEYPDSDVKERTTITGLLPLDQMYQQIKEGAIGLILFQNTHYNSYIGLPNKLFDYMLCGLPVVASNFPEISRVITESQCGILIDTSDSSSVNQAVRCLFSHPDEAVKIGINGRRAAIQKYNWAIMEENLLNIYASFQEGKH
ncbi:glycosyltransferase [Methanofollis fontis]|uniref:Glycosyltransferase WbuB n=1 Tax=Methanofollis fontis TaxID=2052832 RepID=A0A483CMQ5_9EURY|nr:glycosyltransferase [Methanofollis fontis]TAJ44249.1 glycosyltransferase WbuB [Methanofollis fontis]